METEIIEETNDDATSISEEGTQNKVAEDSVDDKQVNEENEQSVTDNGLGLEWGVIFTFFN